MKISFFYFPITLFQKHRFCDQHIASAFGTVNVFNKMSSQQTLGSVSGNCISNFFAGDKTYFFFYFIFKKQYKIGSMPSFCSLFVDIIKFFTRF